MKTTSLLFLSAALLSFSACTTDTPAENVQEAEQSKEEMHDAGSADSVNSEATAVMPVTTPESAPVTNPSATATPAAQPVAATPMPAGSGKPNPPHGQPGHVCGQPVGQPLTGGANPAASVTAPAGINPVQVNIPEGAKPGTVATGAVAAGTNPAHGQPGHNCAVPVGAPLPKN